MLIYVAGPYTTGGQATNIRAAVKVAEVLRTHGHLPFVPHLCHLWELCSPHDYEYWMAMCLEWVAQCDCLIRLPGESPGADREVAEARKLNKPVYKSVRGLINKEQKNATWK